ncbi:MAG: hypothetical protein K0U41_08320 [Gammaproteobacteria bacterium]|nr:hypothetical protein [Gammaproteobacteria bacterium]
MSKNNKLTTEMIQKIVVEYVTTDKKKETIAKKFNVSESTITVIVKRMELNKRKEAYNNEVLEKAIRKCSTRQSRVIYSAVGIIDKHVQRLARLQTENPNLILSSAEIRDVMAILQIISKEHRLDTNQPTDSTVSKVQVMFGDQYIPALKGQQQRSEIVDAEVVEPKPVEPPKQKFHPLAPKEPASEKEEITVEVDSSMIGGII